MGKITKVSTWLEEEWKELRGHHIGGSDAAAVVGLNPYSSPYSVWAEKTGRVPGFEGNLATEVGSYLEEFVAEKFEKETGKQVRNANQSFLNSDYPWAIANVDRLIVGEDAGLEIKTTNALNTQKFIDGDFPSQYYVQCVHYMAVLEKKRWYLAVLVGNKDFFVYTIERNEEEIKALMEAEKEFWEHVENDTPPPVDGSKASIDAVKAVYPEENNDEIVDLMGFEQDLKLYADIGRRINELKADREEIANRIKETIGDNAGGFCDGYRVSWKKSSSTTFDKELFKKQNPFIDLAKYSKKTESRTFRVTELKNKGE
jgi:putative phage-type endonuclease